MVSSRNCPWLKEGVTTVILGNMPLCNLYFLKKSFQRIPGSGYGKYFVDRVSREAQKRTALNLLTQWLINFLRVAIVYRFLFSLHQGEHAARTYTCRGNTQCFKTHFLKKKGE